MSFRGLDFGTGINQYSNLIRQSYVDRENRLRQQEQDRQALFKAGQSGYDVGEDMFTTMANPGITEAEVMDAAAMNQFSTTGRGPAGGASPPQMAPMGQQPAGDSQNLLDIINQYQGPEREQLMEMYYRQNPKSLPGQVQREPSGAQGPLASYGPNNPYPSDDMEANFLAQQLSQGTVENPTSRLPTGPRVTGTQGANDARPPAGTQYQQGGLMSSKALKEFEAKMIDLEAIKARRSKATSALQEGTSAPQEDNFVKSMVQEALVSGRAKMDTNGRVLVHPELAAQIKEMKMLQFKNSMKSGESSLFNTLLENAFKQKDPVPPRPRAPSMPPSEKNVWSQISDVQRKILDLPKLAGDLRQVAMMARTFGIPRDQVISKLKADYEAQLKDLRSQVGQSSAGQSSGAAIKKKGPDGNMYTKEEYQKKFNK